MDLKKYDVSAVMVNYNGERFLKESLSPLFKQTIGDVEVILVDNSSSDRSLFMVNAEFKNEVEKGILKIIELDSNYGFTKGANVGLKIALGKYVAVLNNDVFVPEDFIEKMVNPIESVRDAAAVGCIVETGSSYTIYASAFIRGGYIVRPPDIKVLKRPVYCVAPCGAAALYKKKIFLDANGFDEGFISDWEDHDLGYRLNALGYRCIHNPSVIVRHIGAGSFGGIDYGRLRRIVRNMLLTCYKNYEFSNLWRTVTSLFVYHYHSEKRYRTEKRSQLRILTFLSRCKAAAGGFYDFFKMLPSYEQNRRLIQRRRRSSDLEVFRLTDGKIEW